MSFTIMTDTSANIPTSIAKEHDIVVVPLSYFVGDEEHVCMDTDSFRCAEYYSTLKNGTKITTSQIPPQRYMDYMEPVLEKGDDVLFIGMSAGISGSFSSAVMARELLLEKYPQRHIRLVDSMAASMGEGLLVKKAVECSRKGMSLDDTADMIMAERERLYQVFTVDDLMYLRRGGRLTNAVALVGTLLHIKPLLKGNEHGKIVPAGKVRGRRAVIGHLADRLAELAVDPANSTVAISHAACPEDAQTLADLIREKSGVKDIIIVEHEPVTGSYLGPGALALYFFGNAGVRLA